MNTITRNALCAITVVGALSLGACKTTDDSMGASESASSANASSMPTEAAPMQDDASAPPMDDSSTQPMDDSGMQSDDSGTDSATPTTP